MNKCTGCKHNSAWLGCTKMSGCVYDGKENQTTTPGNKNVFMKKATENQERQQRIKNGERNKKIEKKSKGLLDSITDWLNGNDKDYYN